MTAFDSTKARTIAIAALMALLLLFSGCVEPSVPVLQDNGTYQLKVVMLDVGQGDSILVCSEGQYLLVDAGENDQGDDVVKSLKRLGVDKLTAVVGTHPHSDHIGGLDIVIKSLPVGAVYLPKRSNNTKTYEDLLDAISQSGLKVTVQKPGDTLKLGGADIRFLWPDKGLKDDNDNNYSIVLMVSTGGKRVLLTGDIEKSVEKELLSSGEDLHCDVLKVAHHGSSTSSTKAFLQAAQPKYALISVGKDNEYNHPNADVLNRLDDIGAKVFRTDRNGEITITVTNGQLSVKSK